MILRKYLSWLASTVTLVVLSSRVLPKGFSEIADWLSPLLGPAFRPELDLVFLMLGPSLSYTPLLTTWIVGGVVGGFFARSALRSMAAGTISTLTIILLIAANGFVIFTGLRNLSGGFSGLNIPPPPPGLSLADILNAPMVGQGIEGVASSGGINPVSILESLLVNFILNIGVYAVSFVTSGFVFSKVLRGRRPKPKPFSSTQPQTSPAPQDPSPTLPVAKIVTRLAIVLLLVSSLVISTSFAQGSQSSSPTSGEQLSLNLAKDGMLKMAYSTNLTSLPGVPSDYQREEFRGLAGGFLFAFNGSIDLGQNGTSGSNGPLSFLIPLLPPNGFLAIYTVSDQSTGKARADLLASEFGQGFGVNLSSVVSMILPSFGGQQSSSGSIYIGIYSSDGQAGTLGTRVLSLVQTAGVGSILTSQKIFASHFNVLAGFINLDFQNTTTTIFIPGVQVSADLTPLGNFYGRGSFTLGIRQTFGSQGTIGPSTVARTTNIQLGFPSNSTITGFAPANASINSAQGQMSYTMNLTSTPVQNVYVNFTSTFPQRITVDRQLNPPSPVTSGTTVTEKITVANLGNETIQGVVASEKRLFQTYPTLQLLSSSENVSLGDIPPQGSSNAMLTFKANSDGVYTLPPVDITYSDQGQIITKSSGLTYLQSSFSLSFYFQELVRGTIPYSYLFLLLVVLPPILQIPRLLRRSRPATRRQAQFSPSKNTPQRTEW